MIARIWRATTTVSGAASYRDHFTQAVLPALRDLDGHRGAYVLQSEADGRVELQVVTLWESLEAIRRFAGDDLTTAVVEPAARAVLTEFDDTVAHHDIVINTVTG